MTRGNFVLITNEGNWISIQFNGDMYPSYNGKIVYHMLENINTYDELAAAILKFDRERFGYSYEDDTDITPERISDTIDFSKDYFSVYNSDYLYIKNASNKEDIIVDCDGVQKTIQPDEIQVWNYGRFIQPEYEDLKLNEDERKFVYGDESVENSFTDRLMTIFNECDILLENLPKDLTHNDKEILACVTALWSMLNNRVK